MTDDLVTVERSEAVAILTLSAPDQRNALTAAAGDELRAALERLGETATRAVVLRGEGEVFCAGGDLQAHAARARGELDEAAYGDRLDRVADAVAAVASFPLPTVAAVDGTAFSEGACLALACDIRLGSTEATMGFGFGRLGHSPLAGATALLPRVVAPDVAAELLYTGRMVDAREADELGLLTRVVPAEGFDDELASLLATLSTAPSAALQVTKRLLGRERGNVAAATAAERRAAIGLSETAAFEEGVTAALDGREPDF
jgi:enoyl-CoA hydratase/carnithine racemase